jgi:hypothetical protein
VLSNHDHFTVEKFACLFLLVEAYFDLMSGLALADEWSTWRVITVKEQQPAQIKAQA